MSYYKSNDQMYTWRMEVRGTCSIQDAEEFLIVKMYEILCQKIV